ncbi:pseudouridine synthase [Leeia sp.]|uniref:pseudouridine synthase n=1 Tax=Leeia sp. TaxID=2884678 RepID=UPI0035B2A959
MCDLETLDILYQDDALIAVHKPAGLLVHRSELDRHETRFAVQMLRDQVGHHVYPVHRLDKGTSGLLLFARSAEVCKLAASAFENRQVKKGYLAVVRGWPTDAGEIDHPLTRHADAAADALPQPAQTHFHTLQRIELPWQIDRYPVSRYALLTLEPLTGRQHQLRRHLKHVSHPIIGDATYGKGQHNRRFAEHTGVHRLLLASTRLALPHPLTGQWLELHCPLEANFRQVLDTLGWTEPATSHDTDQRG